MREASWSAVAEMQGHPCIDDTAFERTKKVVWPKIAVRLTKAVSRFASHRTPRRLREN
jgi:hypothetical protein